MHKHHSHFILQKFDETFSYICVHLPRFGLRRHELMSKHDFRTQHTRQTQASSKMWHIAERTHIFQQREQPGIH